MELFAIIVNGLQPLAIFAKKLHLRCLSGFVHDESLFFEVTKIFVYEVKKIYDVTFIFVYDKYHIFE